MNTVSYPALADLVPHAPPMVLLDSLDSVDAESAVCLARVRAGGPFVVARAMPAMVGIELVAQAVAAHVGFACVSRGEPVRAGYLIGVREARMHVPSFFVDDELRVEVRRTFGSESLASYAGPVSRAGHVAAEVTVSVLQEPNA
jgi:predicted hotdog family 3-hydroxylacyl-ACP dehydratase